MGKAMRESIIQPHETNCYICGSWDATDTHHCLSGSANRKKSDEDGLTVKLCRRCHSDIHDRGKNEKLLKQAAQWFWEQEYGTREQFIARYGKSWL